MLVIDSVKEISGRDAGNRGFAAGMADRTPVPVHILQTMLPQLLTYT